MVLNHMHNKIRTRVAFQDIQNKYITKKKNKNSISNVSVEIVQLRAKLDKRTIVFQKVLDANYNNLLIFLQLCNHKDINHHF